MTTRNRPLSPHLQIYKMPFTAILSITHRATGVALAVGTVVLAITVAALLFGGVMHGMNRLLHEAPFRLDMPAQSV